MLRHASPGHLSSRPRRLSIAVATSAAFDVAIVALLVLASRYQTVPVDASTPVDFRSKSLIYLSEPGPGGGGGGGGNRMKDPPRHVASAPAPIQLLNIAVTDLSLVQDLVPGTIEPPVGPPSISQGPGSRNGTGTGDGPGDGPGRGSGLGPGVDRGTGGGPFQPGNDVTRPILLREVKPAYTSDAMRAHLQGSVFLQCVVKPDGSVGEVKVLRSLDSALGLDLEAIKAARQWRFRPGMRRGEPVSVLITIQLDFSLR